MTLQYEDETEGSLSLPCEEMARQVAQAALDRIGCPYETQVSLLITDEENIRQMNRQFRDTDQVTDVLSFPMLSYDRPGDFSFLEEEGADGECFDPESGELVLGDIVICAGRCRQQAQEYGHSLKREFAFLVAHSMLHLMGYDHMAAEEEKVMFSLQEEILQELGIQRD